MLKFISVNNYGAETDLWIAERHIVAIYKDGSYYTLKTSDQYKYTVKAPIPEDIAKVVK